MGRIKRRDVDLPQRMRVSHGAYFYVINQKKHRFPDSSGWHWLSKNRDQAFDLYAKIETGQLERDLLPHLRRLFPLDYLRTGDPAKDLDGSGVYFLWRGDSLHYIGRSKNVANRMRYHRIARAKTKYDEATAIACDRFTSLILEAVHIGYYRPPGNEIV